MKTLAHALEEYLTLRRALGFWMDEAQRLLPRFLAFLEQHGSVHITSELALQWATQSPTLSPAEGARRLTLVRGFARFRAAMDPQSQVPAIGLLSARAQRAIPYLYTETEVAQLLEAAAQLPSPTGLRAQSAVTALGLLSVTGMRVGELLALDDADVDLTLGEVTIRHGKFGKARLLPLHATTQKALRAYVAARDRVFPIAPTPSFLVSEQGTRLSQWSLRRTFVQLSRQIGLRGATDRHGPRLHDFRHRFAVEVLLRWYREEVDVERHLPELSTYLGHVKVADTFWYLSATPELLQLALDRLEQGLPLQVWP
ncbi:tyrosine-type recombinase/integrase [Thiorhodococcus mannitoliphagus]|uniref:Tyrosine-type recombinase/integrase n=1 Tax=Thiorhodococcus mannitoliphagus TaxID=329406 RepID=A0A6P1DRJ9_9GAMM|nr:tyrosine-type recombinase/integrase [Thiorhodococcus mannitoliphagus]NEX20678.1 tyrosine-type recombinase/integrase [Thiorhodococcus mannitoliphagus]